MRKNIEKNIIFIKNKIVVSRYGCDKFEELRKIRKKRMENMMVKIEKRKRRKILNGTF